MNNFQEMGLSPILTKSLDKLGFTQPTSIQAKTIPLALQQKDILGSAQTGTGKTLAFALPLVNQLLNNPTGVGLILTPTRELAQQVMDHVKQLLGTQTSIRTALLIGGDPYAKQMSQLKGNVRIIIGTPGRIIDHLARRSFRADAINFLVLDETDRMFDMGFSIQLQEIVSQLPTQRQTLMFSATFPPKVEKLAAKYMQNPERVFVNESETATVVASNLTQEILEVSEKDKYTELLKQLDNRAGTILVFVKTKSDAESLSIRLNKEDHNTCCIHGNLRQNKRERVMRAFRQGRHQIMIATDIAARGLDVPHVLHVINYDIPYAPEDYVHRIGRTARAGAEGFAMSFVSSQDRKRWNAIQQLLNPEQYKAEQEAARKQNARNTNSRHHSQGNRGSSKSHSQGRGKFSKPEFPRSEFARQGKFSRPRSQEYGDLGQFVSFSQDRPSRSRSQGYGNSSQAEFSRKGQSSRPRSQEYKESTQVNSSRQGRFSKSRSQEHTRDSQADFLGQDRYSKPRSQGVTPKTHNQETKFDRNSRRPLQGAKDKVSFPGFSKNFSNKKSNYRKSY